MNNDNLGEELAYRQKSHDEMIAKQKELTRMEAVKRAKIGWKVIGIDNFDRDTVCDILICENNSKYMGERIAELLNDDQQPDAPYFYKCVKSDYILYEVEA